MKAGQPAALLLLDRRVTTASWMGCRGRAGRRRAGRGGGKKQYGELTPSAKMPTEGARLPSWKEKRAGKSLLHPDFTEIFSFLANPKDIQRLLELLLCC